MLGKKKKKGREEKPFMLENNTGTNRGNEVFNTLQSLNQQTVSTLLTLIKQSATELHNAVIAVYCGEDVIRLPWAFLLCSA